MVGGLDQTTSDRHNSAASPCRAFVRHRRMKLACLHFELRHFFSIVLFYPLGEDNVFL